MRRDNEENTPNQMSPDEVTFTKKLNDYDKKVNKLNCWDWPLIQYHYAQWTEHHNDVTRLQRKALNDDETNSKIAVR